MENRSVDHLLGWYGAENPDFDGTQHVSFRDLRKGPDGPMLATEDWGRDGRNDYDGRGFADPDHGWDNGRLVRNGGLMDGWLHPKTGNDELTLSTYAAHDVPLWAQLTRGWQTYDRWFCSVLGPTQPNRYYLYSGTASGNKNNDLPRADRRAPRVGPRLGLADRVGRLQAGVRVERLLLLEPARDRLLGRPAPRHHPARLPAVPRPRARDAAAGVGHRSVVHGSEGIANDDHPVADIRLGQTFLSDLVDAFTRSPVYRKAAMIITYDEGGGFWDHVDPLGSATSGAPRRTPAASTTSRSAASASLHDHLAVDHREPGRPHHLRARLVHEAGRRQLGPALRRRSASAGPTA